MNQKSNNQPRAIRVFLSFRVFRDPHFFSNVRIFFGQPGDHRTDHIIDNDLRCMLGSRRFAASNYSQSNR
jgi:hypothetical protein